MESVRWGKGRRTIEEKISEKKMSFEPGVEERSSEWRQWW